MIHLVFSCFSFNSYLAIKHSRYQTRNPDDQGLNRVLSKLYLPSDDNVMRDLILETVMTFTLVYVVLATTTSKNFKIVPLAGLAIGFTLGLNVIFGGSITGGSLNPARSFGLALITWELAYQWIYWVAPIAGGLIAAGVYKLLNTKEEQEEVKLPQNSIFKRGFNKCTLDHFNRL